MSGALEMVQRLVMFRGVPRDALEQLMLHSEVLELSAGQVAYGKGDPAGRGALLVLAGTLTVRVGDADKPALGRVHPGEIAGESGLFSPATRRTAHVVAEQATTCLKITDELMLVAPNNPAIIRLEQYLLGSLTRRLRQNTQRLQWEWKEREIDGTPAPPRESLLSGLLSLLSGGNS